MQSRLTKLEEPKSERYGYSFFLCECGTIKEIWKWSVSKGITKSCGCLNREMTITRSITHGMAGRKDRTNEYGIYRTMISRCTNPNVKCYSRYGKRGINVCERWRESFVNFIQDMGERPSSKHSLERVDNSGDYCPENCIWATKETQARNTSTNVYVDGLTLSEIARNNNLSINCVWKRYHKGLRGADLVAPSIRASYGGT